MADHEQEVEDSHLLCAVCLEIFTRPKILPCFHTFCQLCLEHLASEHAEGHFPCPSCREDTQVPAGGVSDFKDNVYIDVDRASKARQGLMCSRHTEREVELWCADCGRCICIMCKLQDHLTHGTEDVHVVTARAKGDIQEFQDRIWRANEATRGRVKVYKAKRQALSETRESVKAGILERHGAVSAALDTIRSRALSALHGATEDIRAGLAAATSAMHSDLDKLNLMRQKAENSQNISSFVELLKTSREFKKGAPGSEEEVEKLTPKSMEFVYRPVLQSANREKEFVDNVNAYIGRVELRKSSIIPEIANGKNLFSEVGVKRHIDCSLGMGNCEVFSLCPEDDNVLWVCYASESVSPRRFTQDGKVDLAETDVSEEINFKYVRGCGFHYPSSDGRFVKADRLWLLSVSGPNKILVQRAALLSTGDPPVSDFEPRFYIRCPKHRACDIDSTERWLVVVAAGPRGAHNEVKLFQNPNLRLTKTESVKLTAPVDASDVYTPPEPDSFQPMDVCFYTLEGQELLVVADVRDAIHVVRVDEGCFRFLRYLAPSCPLIAQPTALNVDIQEGRLWVACRGGNILICIPSPLVHRWKQNRRILQGNVHKDN